MILKTKFDKGHEVTTSSIKGKVTKQSYEDEETMTKVVIWITKVSLGRYFSEVEKKLPKMAAFTYALTYLFVFFKNSSNQENKLGEGVGKMCKI